MLFPHCVRTVSPNNLLNFLLWNSLQNRGVVPLLLKEAVEMPWMQLQREVKKRSSALPPYLAAQVALAVTVTDLLRALGESPLP